MNTGWIALHRSLLDHPRYKDPEWVTVWNYLLLKATHTGGRRDFDGQIVELKPGQLITGRIAISEATGVDQNKVRRILETMQKDGQIDREAGRKGSIVTILNWAKYQEKPQTTKKRGKNKTSKIEQQSEQQTGAEKAMSTESTSRLDDKSEQQSEQSLNNNRTATEQQVTTSNNGTMEPCNNGTKERRRITGANLSSSSESESKSYEASESVTSTPGEHGTQLPAEAVAWNQIAGVLKVESLTKPHCDALAARRQEPEWEKRYPLALKKFSKLKFGKGKTGWTATFDWFLREGNVSGVLNGKIFDGQSANGSGKAKAKKKPDATALENAEVIYNSYPRQDAKGAAIPAIIEAFRKVSPRELYDAVKQYAETMKDVDLKFIPGAAKWFNEERWTDDPAVWASQAEYG